MRDHKELDVWKESVELVTAVYALSKTLPAEELYGLINQMCRSAVSVPSNIAEGAARLSKKEFAHFLYIAAGSLAELETQIIIAEKLTYLSDPAPLLLRVASVRKMIHGLIRHCKGGERIKAGTWDR